MWPNIVVSGAVLGILLKMFLTKRPSGLFEVSSEMATNQEAHSNLFPDVIGKIVKPTANRYYLIAECQPNVHTNTTLQTPESTTAPDIIEKLNVAGVMPVSFLLDMFCIKNSPFALPDHMSDVSLPGENNLIFYCNYRDDIGDKKVRNMPVTFTKGTADAIAIATQHNSVVRVAFAAAFCSAAYLKKNVDLAIEMYIRIITSNADNLASGLFPPTGRDLIARDAAEAEAARKAAEEAGEEKQSE